MLQYLVDGQAFELDTIHPDTKNPVVVDADCLADLIERDRRASFKERKAWLIAAITDCTNRKEVDELMRRELKDSAMMNWHDIYLADKGAMLSPEDEEIIEQINTLAAEDYRDEDDYGHDNH